MIANQLLALPVNDKGKINPCIKKISIDRRRESVEEAIALKKGESQENKAIHQFYEYKNFKIVAGKPGKEAAPNYTGRLGDNINDMTPTLLVNGKKHSNKFAFDNIFELLYEITKRSAIAADLIGCILVRAAFMLDHKKNDDGNWRIVLPTDIINKIEKEVPEVDGMPIRAMLYLFEVIALNEDIKYFTLGKNDDFKKDTGRINNLLTYSHLIGVLLERSSFSKFCGSFAKPPPGVAPLVRKYFVDVFPLLKPNVNNTL